MKRVEAVIPAAHLEDVKERLSLIGVSGMTVIPCSAAAWGTVLVEVVVTDDGADGVVRAVLAVVRRDETGDGRIAVVPIDEAIRISTGQTGADAFH